VQGYYFIYLIFSNSLFFCLSVNMELLILKQSLEKYVTLSEHDYTRLMEFFSYEKIEKKQVLFKEGTYINATVFVLSGCLKSYSIGDNGMEHILQFAPEGWWITDMLSFLKGVKSEFYIESIVESEVLLLTRERQMQMFEAVPKMERYFRIITENALCA